MLISRFQNYYTLKIETYNFLSVNLHFSVKSWFDLLNLRIPSFSAIVHFLFTRICKHVHSKQQIQLKFNSVHSVSPIRIIRHPTQSHFSTKKKVNGQEGFYAIRTRFTLRRPSPEKLEVAKPFTFSTEEVNAFISWTRKLATLKKKGTTKLCSVQFLSLVSWSNFLQQYKICTYVYAIYSNNYNFIATIKFKTNTHTLFPAPMRNMR